MALPPLLGFPSNQTANEAAELMEGSTTELMDGSASIKAVTPTPINFAIRPDGLLRGFIFPPPK